MCDPVSVVCSAGAMMGARDDGEGAAGRRRERRLRSWLRRERHSVAMALSELKHRSSRGQRKDRAGKEGHRDKYEAARRQKPSGTTPPHGDSRARSGEDGRDVLLGRVPVAPPAQGSRPPCLGEPRGPQARVQKHTMEQLADVVPMVQILDFPVPQMLEQLVDVFRFFEPLCPVPEQVIEVPKFVCPLRAARTVLCAPQLAEQLVEVPTLISYSSLQRSVEQLVDIPVPGGGGSISGLQGFSLDRVQQRRLPRNAFLSGLWSRSLTLVLVEVFLVLLLLTLQLVMKSAQMNLAKAFFALFLKIKKCEVGLALGVGTAPRVEPIHAGSSAGGLRRREGEEAEGGLGARSGASPSRLAAVLS